MTSSSLHTPAPQPAGGGPAPRTPRRGQPADGAADAPRQTPERDAFLDNAKYLAIVLVAVGHAWEPLRADSRAVTAAYMALYAFHMPAFILLAGYLSRSFDGSRERVRRLVSTVVAPYVVFQLLYTVFNRWLYQDPDIEVRLLNPFWITWFLMALFVWRLTVPLWQAVRWPVPISLGIAALATVSPYIGNTLDLQRILQFLPFFVLGLFLRRAHFERLRHRTVRLCAVPVFAGALVVAYWAVPRLEYAWFYHRESAQELGAPWWIGLAMALLVFGCSLVLSACFFALVPVGHRWFTVLGAGTLYGFLLHGFLMRGSREWGWYDVAWMAHPVGPVVVTVAAAALMTLLCTPWVRRALRPLVEPTLGWLFRPTAPSGTAADGADRR